MRFFKREEGEGAERREEVEGRKYLRRRGEKRKKERARCTK